MPTYATLLRKFVQKNNTTWNEEYEGEGTTVEYSQSYHMVHSKNRRIKNSNNNLFQEDEKEVLKWLLMLLQIKCIL